MTADLRIGGLLPNVGVAASAEAISTFATESERLGLHSLWVGDHLLLAETQDARYPYNDTGDYVVPSDRNFLEAFTTLTWVAARTQAIRLGVSVCIAPYRHPVQVAKILGTIGFLAPGRMVFGVGTGWLEDEFDGLGVPFAERNTRTADLVRFLRSAGEASGAIPIVNDGFPTRRMFLRPAPEADLPVWIGGNGPLARRRAARLGDAWHPALHRQSPAQLRDEMQEVRELAAGFGRDPDKLELTIFVGVRSLRRPTSGPGNGACCAARPGPSSSICWPMARPVSPRPSCRSAARSTADSPSSPSWPTPACHSHRPERGVIRA